MKSHLWQSAILKYFGWAIPQTPKVGLAFQAALNAACYASLAASEKYNSLVFFTLTNFFLGFACLDYLQSVVCWQVAVLSQQLSSMLIMTLTQF